MTTKIKIRSNKAQIDYLNQYMSQNKDIVDSDEAEMQWAHLQAVLHTLGPHRSIQQWKVCWRDQKRKIRAEQRALAKAHKNTDSGDGMSISVNPNELIAELTPDSVIFLDSNGKKITYECGPVKSPDHSVSEDSEHHLSPPPPQSPAPSTPAPAPASPSNHNELPRIPTPLRKRPQSNTLVSLLKAQLQMNMLLKELVMDVKESNILRREHNNLQREHNHFLMTQRRKPQ